MRWQSTYAALSWLARPYISHLMPHSRLTGCCSREFTSRTSEDREPRTPDDTHSRSGPVERAPQLAPLHAASAIVQCSTPPSSHGLRGDTARACTCQHPHDPSIRAPRPLSLSEHQHAARSRPAPCTTFREESLQKEGVKRPAPRDRRQAHAGSSRAPAAPASSAAAHAAALTCCQRWPST